MKNTSLLFISLLISMIAAGCTSRTQSTSNSVIASVDGTHLYLEDAMNEIPEFVFEEDSAGAIQTYAEQWIRKQVSLQHAERVGVSQTEQFREKMDRFYDQVLEAQLKEYILQENEEELAVTLEEAQNYYQANKDRFMLDETYMQFRHLTTRTRTEADNANREIANGVPWEDVVREYSVDPDLQLRQSSMYWPESLAAADIPALNEYLSIMGITERSPIHFYEGQYHFVQLMDIKSEGEYPELEWLIPQIQEWLTLEKSRRITNAYIRNLYLQAEANNEIELADVSDIKAILSEKFKNQ
ncbi:peptidyl-prolyl cis-trans isomerase [Rhodohalobacter sp. 614A]|uniref:peptidyl-prolyl cis-trans isomerase n=1 Tax=Rhodohalobacter sp. 614A TaxID=2908649 RepID=UPI001F1C64ED|nr:peptidyl-prolyl cis-trans isomerase [Rhodohalobacter sp. 614A]